jgi:hypothetical protein
MYFRDHLPGLVKAGDDGDCGSSMVCDMVCLQVCHWTDHFTLLQVGPSLFIHHEASAILMAFNGFKTSPQGPCTFVEVENDLFSALNTPSGPLWMLKRFTALFFYFLSYRGIKFHWWFRRFRFPFWGMRISCGIHEVSSVASDLRIGMVRQNETLLWFPKPLWYLSQVTC